MAILIALVAAFHYLALGIGLGSIFMRGRYIRTLIKHPNNKDALSNLFIADNFWGLAAVLWLVTGLTRAFGGLEKGSDWYLHNPLFLVKMGVFVLVLILETGPMVTFIRWRIALKRKTPLNTRNLPHLRLHNDLEVILVLLIPLIASAMARGLSY